MKTKYATTEQSTRLDFIKISAIIGGIMVLPSHIAVEAKFGSSELPPNA